MERILAAGLIVVAVLLTGCGPMGDYESDAEYDADVQDSYDRIDSILSDVLRTLDDFQYGSITQEDVSGELDQAQEDLDTHIVYFEYYPAR